MKKIQRYRIKQLFDGRPIPEDDGKWVKYEDVEKLLEEKKGGCLTTGGVRKLLREAFKEERESQVELAPANLSKLYCIGCKGEYILTEGKLIPKDGWCQCTLPGKVMVIRITKDPPDKHVKCKHYRFEANHYCDELKKICWWMSGGEDQPCDCQE